MIQYNIIYTLQAYDGAKIFYDVSANATELAEKSKAEYNAVETNKSICVNDGERKYVESTTKCYTELNDCLVGKGPPNTTEKDYGTTVIYTTEGSSYSTTN